MKHFILAIGIILSLAQPLQAQEIGSKGKIGVTYTFLGNSDVVYFQDIDGGGGYVSDRFYSVGLIYQQPLSQYVELITGVEYADHQFVFNPPFNPNIDTSPFLASVSLVNIPAVIRLSFLDYFFVEGGGLVNINVENSEVVDSQTGLGVTGGLGVIYDFDFGLSVLGSPYFKIHSLLSFSPKNYPQRLTEVGVKFGVLYDLNRIL